MPPAKKITKKKAVVKLPDTPDILKGTNPVKPVNPTELLSRKSRVVPKRYLAIENFKAMFDFALEILGDFCIGAFIILFIYGLFLIKKHAIPVDYTTTQILIGVLGSFLLGNVIRERI